MKKEKQIEIKKMFTVLLAYLLTLLVILCVFKRSRRKSIIQTENIGRQKHLQRPHVGTIHSSMLYYTKNKKIALLHCRISGI